MRFIGALLAFLFGFNCIRLILHAGETMQFPNQLLVAVGINALGFLLGLVMVLFGENPADRKS